MIERWQVVHRPSGALALRIQDNPDADNKRRARVAKLTNHRPIRAVGEEPKTIASIA
jgi:hypothetical protein